MAPIRGTLARGTALLVVTLTLFTVGACSSSSKGTTVSASDAAATVASAYSLPDDQKACLEQAFHDHPEATRPLATDRTANDADVEALGQAENGCVHADTLAAAVTAGAADGFGSITDQQRTCLNDTIDGLSSDDRVTLLVGFTLSQSLSDAKRVTLGQVVNGILDACHLALDTQTTGDPSATDATGDNNP